ncbi:MAG: L-histidine N(alpha)-methyltransferase [Algicola sp.]|nr:L-histidine N(alpha)-methyltransferase [Algicola sp.]
MNQNQSQSAEAFNPADLGPSLCMKFDAVVKSFAQDPNQRVNGALSGYIYDVPQFVGDRVDGGLHYAQYVELPTSLIPQKQPGLLKLFAQHIKDTVKPGASFYDLGPGPGWSVKKNTIPVLDILKPAVYVAVDLEPEFTAQACKVVAQQFVDMKVSNLASNFHQQMLPMPPTDTSIIWYPGSTLGNLPSLPGQTFLQNEFIVEHLSLLRQYADQTGTYKTKTEHTRYLLILMDSKKDNTQAMVDLYASEHAVGCFKSILFKLQRDLKAKNFDPEAFVYQPRWNEINSTVEHVFTATRSQTVQITDAFTDAREMITVLKNEEYVLANSMKPSAQDMMAILTRSGWTHLQLEMDKEKRFHMHLVRTSTKPSTKQTSI